jgi:hypothetical protein
MTRLCVSIRVIFWVEFSPFLTQNVFWKDFGICWKKRKFNLFFANFFGKTRHIFDITKMEKTKKNIGERNLVSFYHVCLLAAFVGSAYSEGKRNYERFFIWSHISRNVHQA